MLEHVESMSKYRRVCFKAQMCILQTVEKAGAPIRSDLMLQPRRQILQVESRGIFVFPGLHEGSSFQDFFRLALTEAVSKAGFWHWFGR